MKVIYPSNAARMTPVRSDGGGQTVGLKIRTGTVKDLPAVVQIHQGSFPETLMTYLGTSFLRCYYQQVLGYRGGILLVVENQEGIQGFVSGVFLPERFYRRMVFSSWRYVGPLLLAVLRRPSLLATVAYSLGRVLRSTPGSQLDSRCELTSLAVVPLMSGRGLGAELTRDFLHASWQRSAKVVCLTTDAEDNESVNRFYSKLGFQVRRTFRQCGGCLTNEYTMTSPMFGQKRTC